MAITAAMLQKGWTPKRQTIDFAPIKQSRIGELGAKFDIVLGHTPQA